MTDYLEASGTPRRAVTESNAKVSWRPAFGARVHGRLVKRYGKFAIVRRQLSKRIEVIKASQLTYEQ